MLRTKGVRDLAHSCMDEVTHATVHHQADATADAAHHAEHMGAAVVALATSPVPVCSTISTGGRCH